MLVQCFEMVASSFAVLLLRPDEFKANKLEILFHVYDSAAERYGYVDKTKFPFFSQRQNIYIESQNMLLQDIMINKLLSLETCCQFS